MESINLLDRKKKVDEVPSSSSSKTKRNIAILTIGGLLGASVLLSASSVSNKLPSISSYHKKEMGGNLFRAMNTILFGKTISSSLTEESEMLNTVEKDESDINHESIAVSETKKEMSGSSNSQKTILAPVHKISSKRAGMDSDMQVVIEDSVVKLKEVPEVHSVSKLPDKSSIEDPVLSKSLNSLEAVIEDKDIHEDGKNSFLHSDNLKKNKDNSIDSSSSASTTYSLWDRTKATPTDGYYFPISMKPTSTKQMEYWQKVMKLDTASDMPGSPAYIEHRQMTNSAGLVGKNVMLWDMSRDSKIADYADGQFIVAAVEGESLYYSSDSGETFTSYGDSAGVRDFIDLTINMEGEKLAFIAGGKSRAVCSLFTSTDFGVSWTQSKKAGTGQFVQLAANFAGDRLFIAVNGDVPAIKYTTDGGYKWTEKNTFPVPPGTWTLLEVDHNGDNIYAASEQSTVSGGLMFRSVDHGKTFTVISAIGTKNWLGIYPQNFGDRVFFTAYNDTNIYYSKNNGDTVQITGVMPVVNSKLCVSFEQYGGGFIYALAPGDYMYKSFDKGLVFHKDTSVGIQDWDKCLMTSMGTFDVVSVKGQGFFTDKAYPSPLTDEQIGFPFRYSAPITSVPNVLQEVTQSPNGEFIVAAFGNTLEDGSGIHISGDRGLSWHQTNLQVDRFEAHGIRISPNGTFIGVIGWSKDLDRNLYVSTDGGDSWSSNSLTKDAQMLESSGDLQHLYVTMEGEIDDPAAFVLVSHDYGQSFRTIYVNYTSFYMWTSIDVSFDGSKVYASSFDTHGNGFLYKSLDYGETWLEIPHVDPGIYIFPTFPVTHTPVADWNAIVCSDDGQIVVAQAYMSNLIYRSTDSGNSWLRIASAPDVFTGICIDGSGQVLMGVSSSIYRSYDGGLSWGLDTLSGSNGWIQCSMSSDGTKSAIKRYLAAGAVGPGTGVYVNEPWPPTPAPTAEPTREPIANPTKPPTFEPSANPTREPTPIPTGNPIFAPTFEPTKTPIAPTYEPSYRPSAEPTILPTFEPSYSPTPRPSAEPTLEPSKHPVAPPTLEPTHEPTLSPSPRPSPLPTFEPTPQPSLEPTLEPTLAPIDVPTMEPTPEPSMTPTYEPTVKPSMKPTATPTVQSTPEPTITHSPLADPTLAPTDAPTMEPTKRPISEPTVEPTRHPVVSPTAEPWASGEPTREPSKKPIMAPTLEPTRHPHTSPTYEPTYEATPAPTAVPNAPPTNAPIAEPTLKPTDGPTVEPTSKPTMEPTKPLPTAAPSSWPPTMEPTHEPSHHPVAKPTHEPTRHPVANPTKEPFTPDMPTYEPTKHPVATPTFEPTKHPAAEPSGKPNSEATPAEEPSPVPPPKDEPTANPTERPTPSPSAAETSPPSPVPGSPTTDPTHAPSAEPTEKAPEPVPEPAPKPVPEQPGDNNPAPSPILGQPTAKPTTKPTLVPSEKPTVHPSPAPGKPTASPTVEPTLSPTEAEEEGSDDKEPETPSTDDFTPPEAPPAPLPIVCANDNGTSTFCPGLLPNTVAKVHLLPGCVLFAINDLTQVKKVPKYQESAVLVICASTDSGVIKVDETVLTEFDMVFEGQSLISSVIFGPDTSIKMYSEGNFDGMSTTVAQSGKKTALLSLATKKYGPRKPSANDNVRSFELTSGSTELNKCESAMEVYYFSDFEKKKKRLRVRI